MWTQEDEVQEPSLGAKWKGTVEWEGGKRDLNSCHWTETNPKRKHPVCNVLPLLYHAPQMAMEVQQN